MVAPYPQIPPPNYKLQLVNKDGTLTTNGMQFLQRLWAQVVNSNQDTPNTATNVGNDYILTVFPTPTAGEPLAYYDYNVFTFVAPATSTGSVTANVNGLGDKKVYKSNGASQAGSGDVVINSLYLLVYNSALDSGNGGFVLK